MRTIACTVVAMSFLISCSKKDSNISKLVPLSSITVVNGVVGTQGIVPNFSLDSVQWYAYAQSIPFGYSFEYSVPSGITPISMVQPSDSTVHFYLGKVPLDSRAIYSLFLTGTVDQFGKGAIDTLLTSDKIPSFDNMDSVLGLRFVNISVGQRAISVNQQGMPVGSDVVKLNYKGITNFKNYTCNSNIGSYTFEIRDYLTDSLLTTFTFNNLLVRRSFTVAVVGKNQGSVSTDPVNAVLIPNF